MNKEYETRRAPYAPISALREFFERMRVMSSPARVDRRFLQKLNVASNNEWALLSALKFLGIVDQHGAPTHAYRLLQTTDRFQETLAHLVRQAYKDLFEMDGLDMQVEDLRNYFRVTSSPSQAKNAARFFREVCALAGVGSAEQYEPSRVRETDDMPPLQATASPDESERKEAFRPSMQETSREILAAKARLLEKLPAPRSDWTAEEYAAICDRFLVMLEHLGGTR